MRRNDTPTRHATAVRPLAPVDGTFQQLLAMPLSRSKESESPRLLSTRDFHAAGISIADWARERKFNVRLVYAIVRGERKCLRGESARIAKELGMK